MIYGPTNNMTPMTVWTGGWDNAITVAYSTNVTVSASTNISSPISREIAEFSKAAKRAAELWAWTMEALRCARSLLRRLRLPRVMQLDSDRPRRTCSLSSGYRARSPPMG